MGPTTNQKCNIYYVACYDLVQEYQTSECSAEETTHPKLIMKEEPYTLMPYSN